MAEGMYSKLMELNKEQTRPAQGSPPPTDDEETPANHTLPLLPLELEDPRDTGSKSHSYRFTINEIHWLRRFCDHLSVELDRDVSHNTLVRLLLRLALAEWEENPDSNRLRHLIVKARKL